MKQWKCTVCGYVHTGDEPPLKCPVCGADKSKFILLEDGSSNAEKKASPITESEKAPSELSKEDKIEKQWKCSVCGYIHKGIAPPSKCPVCGADKSKFELLEERTSTTEGIEPSDGTPNQATLGSTSTSEREPGSKPSFKEIAARVEILTRFHGHPIAVHIPNGVLPLAFIFTLLSVVFNSNALAIAAKYNMIFICLAMPVVLLTGVVDWVNRFNAAITNVFLIKMICAGVVTFLSFIIAIWWIVEPDIYLAGSGKLAPFLFLCLTDLAAAAVAGFYGGKLVFKD